MLTWRYLTPKTRQRSVQELIVHSLNMESCKRHEKGETHLVKVNGKIWNTTILFYVYNIFIYIYIYIIIYSFCR